MLKNEEINGDGGMAFPMMGSFQDPISCTDENGNEWLEPGATKSERGMSLRDYFAAKIMAALIVARPEAECDEGGFARDSYRFANAMIEARKMNEYEK